MSTSPVNNSSSVASSIATPLTVTTGTSTFATDLQASVNRAIEIASLPMEAVQNDETTVNSQITELNNLGTLFGNLQTSLQTLASGAGSNAMAASVDNSSVAQASLSAGALPGTYSVDLLTAGSSSSVLSNETSTPVTDPTSQDISQSAVFTLTVDGVDYTIQPPTQTLNSLAASINASGAPVQAVVVNLGTPEAPDYRLVLQSTALGNVSMQLNDGTNDLMSSLTTGQDASYTVDGQPPGGITTDASTVTVAPGVNVTLGNTTGVANITVSSSLNSVSSALSSFVNSFNAVVAELQKNFGTGGGALVGDPSVLNMQQVLDQVVNYTGSGGSITSLAQLGVEFTQQGTLTFDSSALSDLSPSQINDALTFLGNPNSGGFLQNATNTLDQVTDPTDGIIVSDTGSLQNELTQDQTEVTNDQQRLTTLQQNLQAQMAQANALIAQLQQQTTFLEGMFQYSTSNNPYASSVG
ncbi:MAG TPA: flagellar filament capping protein FliD [Bryobacteraceae bacterium]|nr:flagellar filament capping protein FliD [Bryobacteraceae bacterium]